MSSYKAWTKHPNTGYWEYALWMDDHFGKHHYGVFFSSDKRYYDPWGDTHISRDINEEEARILNEYKERKEQR